MLIDVSFNQKEGLKLIQEVNSIIPYRFTPMLCLAIAWAYNEDTERSIIILKECIERFEENSYICYVYCAYLRVQQISKYTINSNPIMLDFLNNKVSSNSNHEEKTKGKEVFTDRQVEEIDALMSKSIRKLLARYVNPNSEIDLSMN